MFLFPSSLLVIVDSGCVEAIFLNWGCSSVGISGFWSITELPFKLGAGILAMFLFSDLSGVPEVQEYHLAFGGVGAFSWFSQNWPGL